MVLKLCSMPSVFRFLIEVAMKTKLDATKQHAYYAISLFGIKLNLNKTSIVVLSLS